MQSTTSPAGLVAGDPVDAGDGLHEAMSTHRLVDVHGVERLGVEPGEPHACRVRCPVVVVRKFNDVEVLRCTEGCHEPKGKHERGNQVRPQEFVLLGFPHRSPPWERHPKMSLAGKTR